MKNNKVIFNITVMELFLILFFMVFMVFSSKAFISSENTKNDDIGFSKKDLISKKEDILNKLSKINAREQIDNIISQNNPKNKPTPQQVNIIHNILKQNDKKNNIANLQNNLFILENDPIIKQILLTNKYQPEPLKQEITQLINKLNLNDYNTGLINKILNLENNISMLTSQLDKPTNNTVINNLKSELNNTRNELQNSFNQNMAKYIPLKIDDKTKKILQNLEMVNKPLKKQIYNLQNILKSNNLKIPYSNIQQALNELKQLNKVGTDQSLSKLDIKTEHVLKKLEMEHNPLKKQILDLQNILRFNDLGIPNTDLMNALFKLKQAKKQILNLENLSNSSIMNALNNLKEVNKTDPNYSVPRLYNKTENILKKLNIERNPLKKQILDLQNILFSKKLDIPNSKLEDAIFKLKQVKKQILDSQNILNSNNLKISNSNINNLLDKLQQAHNLDVNNTSIKLDNINKNLLKKLGIENEPLKKQIIDLNNILKNNKLLIPNIDIEDTLNKLKYANNTDINNTPIKLDNKTQNLLKKLGIENKPFKKQIIDLNNIIKANKLLISNIDMEDTLNKLKLANNTDVNNTPIKLDNETKDILKKLGIDNKPLKKQILDLNNILKTNQLTIPNIDVEDTHNNLDSNKSQIKHDNDIENILKKLDMKNNPLKKQVSDLNNLHKDNNLTVPNIKLEDTLNKLKQAIKTDINNTPLKLDNKNKDILKKLGIANKPLKKQISNLENILKPYKLKIPNVDVEDALNKLKQVHKLDPNKSPLNFNNKNKNLLKKLGIDNEPLKQQIHNLDNILKTNKLAIPNVDIEDTLNKLNQPIKTDVNNTPIKLDDKTNNILKKLGIENDPFRKQISNLENIIKPNKLKIPTIAIGDALNNLKQVNNIDINNTPIKIDNTTEDILKKLAMVHKPLKKQILDLQNILKPYELNIPNNDIEDALNNLKKVHKLDIDKTPSNLDNKSKNLLKKLGLENEPLNKQISNLNNILESNKLKIPNVVLEDALNKLNNVHNLDSNNTPIKLDNKIKNLLKKLGIENEPSKKQILNLNKIINPNKLTVPNIDMEDDTTKSTQINMTDTNKSLSTPDDDIQDLLTKLGIDNEPLKKQILDLNNILEFNKLEIPNVDIEDAIDKLEQVHNFDNNTPIKPDNKIKDLLKKLGINYDPSKKQISALEDLLNPSKLNINNVDIEDALNNLKQANKSPSELKDIAENVLKKLKIVHKPLKKQISQLKDILKTNKLYIPNVDFEYALEDLNQANETDINKSLPKLEEETENILKRLRIVHKPLKKQISQLEDILNTNKLDIPNIDFEDTLKYLKPNKTDLNDSLSKYDDKTEDILKKLNIVYKPAEEQISDLQNILKSNFLPVAKTDIMDSLNKLKQDNTTDDNKSLSKLDEKTEDILKKLRIVHKPLDEQISDLEKVFKSNNLTIPDIDMKDALNNLSQLNDIETDDYVPVLDDKTKNILEKLSIVDKPLKDQMSDLQNIVKSNDFDIDNILDKKRLINKLDKIIDIKKKINDINDSKLIVDPKVEYAIKKIEQMETQDYDENNTYEPKVQEIVKKFNLQNKTPDQQLDELFKKLYVYPSNDIDEEYVNEVINLDNKTVLENKLKRINDKLKSCDKNDAPYNKFEFDNNQLKNRITYLKNKLKLAEGHNHNILTPCTLDNQGHTEYIFTLTLREKNIYVEHGWKIGREIIGEGVPNMDKLLDKTVSLNKFMKLTKPIFELSIQKECRYFVYFIDETISKKQYKKTTLTIQHHFYKYIDHTW